MEAFPQSMKLSDVSRELRQLMRLGLLERGVPSYPRTDYESYTITMEGGFFIRKSLYESISGLSEERGSRIVERLKGSEKQRMEFKKFLSKLRDKSQDQIIDEILRLVKQYTVLGLHLVIILVKESL